VAESAVADRSQRAAELYARYGPAVYRRCLRLLGESEAAKDATQEVFVKLVGTLEELESRVDLLPWVFRVATNHRGGRHWQRAKRTRRKRPHGA
jgi:RNA polymerase sigma-70 factor, ECF subfamily